MNGLSQKSLGRRLLADRALGLCVAVFAASALLVPILLLCGLAAGALGPHIAGGGREPWVSGLGEALKGSFVLIFTGFAAALPLGLATALWLVEFSRKGFVAGGVDAVLRFFSRLPLVFYGLGILVLSMRFSFSGMAPAVVTALVFLPRVVRVCESALRRVPASLRWISYSLGVTRPRVVMGQVLPQALEDILAELPALMGRMLGIAVPFVILAASPLRGSDDFTVLPLLIFQWVDASWPNPQAAAGALFLVAVIVLLNLATLLARWRVARRREGLR